MPTLRAPRQLPPTVLAKSDNVSGTDHLVNRFSAYGEVSAMSGLLASALLVYRLKVQLLITRGMALCPVFVHYQDSQVFEDPRAGSKRSRHQVKVGLDLLNGSVQDLHIDPNEVAVIAPCAANVKLTIDETQLSFPGQEGSIALKIMITDHPRPEPGFTHNKQRLNVLLNRQRCALLLFDNTSFGDSFRNSAEKPLFKVDNSAGEIFVKRLFNLPSVEGSWS
ncbi:hypothetical protein NW766_003887 [Fusarium irregulare]|uniref:DNA2/NAM7 helicase-like C-terminal domain-containing protein n=1 Tax=Fusarium irregulare TaxID=2494466 RepID=A0A9W8PTJ8_9HYPO|nr:hypothetical protein NW766_003887 [Fusarium irregulare]